MTTDKIFFKNFLEGGENDKGGKMTEGITVYEQEELLEQHAQPDILLIRFMLATLENNIFIYSNIPFYLKRPFKNIIIFLWLFIWHSTLYVM